MSGEWVKGYVMCCTVLSDVFNGALGGVRWGEDMSLPCHPSVLTNFFRLS